MKANLGTFRVDASPELGQFMGGTGTVAESIEDPQYARGVVLGWEGKTFVVCALDWCVLANGSHDRMRRAIGRAVGCPQSHVALHVIHQHDAVVVDHDAERHAFGRGLPETPVRWFDGVVSRVAAGAASAKKRAEAVTAVGTGSARVEDCASNRRILGPDGRVMGMRFSLCHDRELKSRPVGLIDPMMDTVVLFGRKGPLASVSLYASHPQTAWGRSVVSGDTTGEALRLMGKRHPKTFHMYLTGCGANVTFGKFSTRDKKKNIAIFGERLFRGMDLAFGQAVQDRRPLSGVAVRAKLFELPLRRFDRAGLEHALADPLAPPRTISCASRELALFSKPAPRRRALVQALRLNEAHVLFLPSEVFVEYQLFAKARRPDRFVAVAAYGDGKFGYIGTSRTEPEGGYEANPSIGRTDPGAIEPALSQVIAEMIPER